MKKLPSTHPGVRRHHQRGSILVICMVLAGLGTLGTAAFFSLIAAKSQESEQMNVETERRTKRANSLALAKEVVMRKYLAADKGPDADETHTLPGGWGECTIGAFADAPMAGTGGTRTHKTGATPVKAFSYDIDVEIGDGESQQGRQFQIKSRNPVLGGDLFYMGQPTINGGASNGVSGDINVKGRARLWTGGYKHTISIQVDEYVGVDPYNAKLTLNDTDGNPLLGQNFPFVNLTSGRHGGAATPAYDGTASVIVNGDTPWNTYAEKIANSGDFKELDGEVVETGSGLGGPTNPPTPDDLTLISFIQSLPPGLIQNALWPYRPLSSNVLTALWNQGFPSGLLKVVLIDNSYLPEDILQLVIANAGSVLSSLDRQEVLDANGGGGGAFTSDGLGGITLDLDAADAKHLVVKNVQSLVIEGQGDATAFAAADALDPIVVVIHNDPASTKVLQSIEFQNENNRRLILAVKQENSNAAVAVTCSGGAFPDWRMIANFENVPVTADLGTVSSATLKGGIWTDRSFEVPNGTLTVEPETNPGNLEFLGARVAWLEVFRN